MFPDQKSLWVYKKKSVIYSLVIVLLNIERSQFAFTKTVPASDTRRRPGTAVDRWRCGQLWDLSQWGAAAPPETAFCHPLYRSIYVQLIKKAWLKLLCLQYTIQCDLGFCWHGVAITSTQFLIRNVFIEKVPVLLHNVYYWPWFQCSVTP